jgi:predicted permease
MPLVPTTELESRSNRSLDLFAILKPGTPIARASADLEAIAHRLSTQYPKDDKGVDVLVQTFHQRYNGGPIRLIFLLMLAAVGFVLLIACANVANMMLSRALGRQREISIRAALGASRWRVIRQLLIESLLLSTLGGAVGLGLAALGVHWFDLSTQNVGKPYWVTFNMNYAVFGYFAALCICSGLLFGLAPAIRSSRVDLNSSLKDGVRSVGTHRGGALSSLLVVFQFALTLVLLTGAGVFARSFIESLSLNSNVPASQLLTAHVSLPVEHYADGNARQHFFDQLLLRLRALPGVTDVAIGSSLPGLGASGVRHIEIEHTRNADPAHGPSADILVQSPGYFNAINLPILLGRDFNETDGSPGRESVIVTREFADRYWPHQAAVGKRFRFYEKDKATNTDKPGAWLSVIGVSANILQEPFEKAPNPLVFLPYRFEQWDGMSLLVRSNGNPTAAVRAAVQNLDQDLPLTDVSTLTEMVVHQQWYLRLFSKLFAAFALIALAMASVGIYAVIAQATSRRTQEIGVRMALGATSRNILALVLSRGMKQLIAGLAIGLAAAIPAMRLMSSLPIHASSSDPLVLITVSLLLAAVGLFACWIPARRAAALDPVKAIRYE